MKKILKKFSLIDYIIIILVICAVIFAFIHITSDDTAHIEKTAFDTSTINKISDTYFSNYKDGNLMKVSLNGFNATDGKEVSLNGTLKWFDDNGGSDVRLLVESNNETYLTGIYKSVPEADIYLNSIIIESDGSKYDNLVEFKLKPENITSLNDLVNKIPDGTDYELSTAISTDSVDSMKMQEIKNAINGHDKRLAIKNSNSDPNNEILLVRANDENMECGDSVLGNINGITDEITLRVYNCNDSQLDAIKNNYDIINIRNF